MIEKSGNNNYLHDGCVIVTHHQGSSVFSPSKGLQCVPNLACALLYSLKCCPTIWHAGHLDDILQACNNLYRFINNRETLLPSDIPNFIRYVWS